MPESVLASTVFPPNGDRILTPPLAGLADNEYRIVLEGLFSFQSMRFDPVYKLDSDGARGPRHSYLRWFPSAPNLLEEDPVRHRYAFRVLPAHGLEGSSLGVQLDIDRLVDETLLTPSEVRNHLSGEMTFSTLQTPLAPPLLWPRVALASVPAGLAVGGIAWVIRRRAAFRGLDADLVETVARIDRKARQAQAEIARSSSARAGLKEEIAGIAASARGLARSVQSARSGRSLANRRDLESQIDACRRQLASSRPEGRHETESILREREHALTVVSELEQAESTRRLRLARVEAVLDSALVTLASVRTDPAAARSEEALCRELSAEISAVREVAADAARQELKLTA